MAKSRKKFLCLDCPVDTGKIHEHYYIELDTWMGVVGSKTGMLCIGCLETRLGRLLVPGDFTDASINSPKYEAKSTRLMKRMGL